MPLRFVERDLVLQGAQVRLLRAQARFELRRMRLERQDELTEAYKVAKGDKPIKPRVK